MILLRPSSMALFPTRSVAPTELLGFAYQPECAEVILDRQVCFLDWVVVPLEEAVAAAALLLDDAGLQPYASASRRRAHSVCRDDGI